MIGKRFQGRVLTVAGSDPTCGAGMPMDIRMIGALGGIPQAALTAITVQDTAGVSLVHPLPGTMIAQQMRAALDDVGVDCIKLGMLATAENVKAVVAVLEIYPDVPVVADPVLAGTRGGVLLDPSGLDLWRKLLLPRATLITPNLPEAHILVDQHGSRETRETEESLALALATAGCSVLLKGGHGEGDDLIDLLCHKGHMTAHRHPRIKGASFHGTGCALASAVATFLAFGLNLEESVAKGLATVLKAMENGRGTAELGRGQRLLTI